MAGLFSKILSMGSDKELKEFQKIADRVNGLAPTYAGKSDEELAAMTPLLKETCSPTPSRPSAKCLGASSACATSTCRWWVPSRCTAA